MTTDVDDDLRRLFEESAEKVTTLSPGFTDTVLGRGHTRRRARRHRLLAGSAAAAVVIALAAWQSHQLVGTSTPQPSRQTPTSPSPEPTLKCPAAHTAIPGVLAKTNDCIIQPNGRQEIGGRAGSGLVRAAAAGSRWPLTVRSGWFSCFNLDGTEAWIFTASDSDDSRATISKQYGHPYLRNNTKYPLTATATTKLTFNHTGDLDDIRADDIDPDSLRGMMLDLAHSTGSCL